MLPLLITQFLYVQWWDEIAFVFNVTIMQCCCLCVQCVHVEFMIFSVWLCVCVLWCWLFVLCTITICRWWWFINVCSKTFTTCETDLFMLNVHFITINKWFFLLNEVSGILSWSNCFSVEKLRKLGNSTVVEQLGTRSVHEWKSNIKVTVAAWYSSTRARHLPLPSPATVDVCRNISTAITLRTFSPGSFSE